MGERSHALVQKQAEDDGLWFKPETAPEAYLQQALRELHAAVEGVEIQFKCSVCGRPFSDAGECDSCADERIDADVEGG